jgi:prophage antirepressor-like protein
MNPSIFNFNEHGVRIVLDDSKEPWFCLTDVYKSLDISRTSRLFRELDPKGVADDTPYKWRYSKAKFINEPNLYRIIFRSNKPEALNFQNWVFAEVLPSIRKTGYIARKTPLMKN